MTVRWTTTRLVIASLLILPATGLVHRWVYDVRAAAAFAYRPPINELESISKHLGGYEWRRDRPLANDVLQAANFDTYISREYADLTKQRLASLYVGYWGRENLGMGHGPEVCFPAVGWQEAGEMQPRTITYRNEDGTENRAVAAMHHFTKVEPEGIERVAVGFLAVYDGAFHASSRGVFMHGPPTEGDQGFLAHVEVTMGVRSANWEDADAELLGILESLLPEVSKCLFVGAKPSAPPVAPGQGKE